MQPERFVRGFAGFLILGSIVLGAAQGQVDLGRFGWIWLTAFVGLNLLQSAFTDWCPLLALLRRGRAPRDPAAAH